MSKNSQWRRKGRQAFYPGGDPQNHLPYRPDSTHWGAETNNRLFLDGWNQAALQHEANEKHREEHETRDGLLSRIAELASDDDLRQIVEQLEAGNDLSFG